MKRFVFLAAIALSTSSLVARQTVDAPRSLTTADYARAEKFLAATTASLVYHAALQPTWLADERSGTASPRKRAPRRCWSTPRPAPGVLHASGVFASGRRTRAGSRRRHGHAQRNDIPSPDGTRTAFIKDWNLWVRDVATGKETALTTDGVKDFGYATDNAGWTKSDRPILLWAPDSKKIATFQQDQRDVGEMYLVRDRRSAIRRSKPGSIRCPATSTSPCCSALSSTWTRRRSSA